MLSSCAVRSRDPHGLIVRPVGKGEPAQPVIDGGEANPGFEVVWMELGRAAEMTSGQAEIAGAVVLPAQFDVVVGRW